ncbi:MAG: hypothetical protein INR65_13715 [Gluconacetobacter diazotrophicus]|nr:hypothetical protein [Gluconacetobacter diazotrophicus]
MNHLKNTIYCLAVAAATCALAGCQDDAAKQGGTYTAARHMAVGSHVPQRADVANTSSVYAPPTEASSISTNNGTIGVPSGTR